MRGEVASVQDKLNNSVNFGTDDGRVVASNYNKCSFIAVESVFGKATTPPPSLRTVPQPQTDPPAGGSFHHKGRINIKSLPQSIKFHLHSPQTVISLALL